MINLDQFLTGNSMDHKAISGIISFFLLLLGVGVKRIRVFVKDEIINYFLERCLARFRSLVHGEEANYRRLAYKFVKSTQIGGLREQLPVRTLGELFINIKCGIVNKKVAGLSSIVDNLSEVPITSRTDLISLIKTKKHFNTVVLLGGPGAGKTTVINHSIEHILKNKSIGFTPVPLVVRDLVEHIDNPCFDDCNLLDVVEKYFREYAICDKDEKFPKEWVSRQMKAGRCVLFIDGIDELISEGRRDKFLFWLKREIRRYGENKYIITSRPHGIKGFAIDKSITRYMCPLDDDSVSDFIYRWYRQVAIDECEFDNLTRLEDIERIKRRKELVAKGMINRVSGSRLLREFSRKPMILTMMLIVDTNGSTLPERRCELFDHVLSVMLGGRSSAKGIRQVVPRDVKMSILSIIAYYLVSKSINDVSLLVVRNIISKFGKNYSVSFTAEEFVDEVLRNSGIIVKTGPENFAFCHKSFKDYLASEYLRDRMDRINTNELVKLAEDTRWKEVILLLFGQMDATEYINKLIVAKNIDFIELLVILLEEAKEIDIKTKKKAEIYLLGLANSGSVKNKALVGRAMLRKRLMNFGSGDELEVDAQPLTTIEYDYFIYSSEGVGFGEGLNGNNHNPLTSIKIGHDKAQEFCEWFTRTVGDGWVYRLPDIEDNVTIQHELKWVSGLRLSSQFVSAAIRNKFTNMIQVSLRKSIERDFFICLSMSRKSYSIFSSGPLSITEKTTRDIDYLFDSVLVASPAHTNKRAKNLYFLAKICEKYVPAETYFKLLKKVNISNTNSIPRMVNLDEDTCYEIEKRAVSFRDKSIEIIKDSCLDLCLGNSVLGNLEYLQFEFKKIGLELDLNYLNMASKQKRFPLYSWSEVKHWAVNSDNVVVDCADVLRQLILYSFLIDGASESVMIHIYLNLCLNYALGISPDDSPLKLEAVMLRDSIAKRGKRTTLTKSLALV